MCPCCDVVHLAVSFFGRGARESKDLFLKSKGKHHSSFQKLTHFELTLCSTSFNINGTTNSIAPTVLYNSFQQNTFRDNVTTSLCQGRRSPELYCTGNAWVEKYCGTWKSNSNFSWRCCWSEAFVGWFGSVRVDSWSGKLIIPCLFSVMPEIIFTYPPFCRRCLISFIFRSTYILRYTVLDRSPIATF